MRRQVLKGDTKTEAQKGHDKQENINQILPVNSVTWKDKTQY